MTTTTPDPDRPLRGRRISWREFYAMRPDLRSDNDNQRPVDNGVSPTGYWQSPAARHGRSGEDRQRNAS